MKVGLPMTAHDWKLEVGVGGVNTDVLAFTGNA